MLWTSRSAVEATRGRCDRDFAATGVSIDTRTLAPGDLFVALKGPNFDGHDYVVDAMAKGAAAAMVHRLPAGVSGDAPVLMTDDTMKALADLAAAARARAKARIIAVTGSVGKTGIKEALKLVLGAQAPTFANAGNLNNHWGLPLSLARMPEETVYGIFEMGMNHPGEITPLSMLAKPHVAVISTVEPVHSAFFSDVTEIADAKAEIFAGMEHGADAVLNRDNPHFQRLADAAKAGGAATVRSFGAHEQAWARLVDCSFEADGSRITAKIGDEIIVYRIGVVGRHWAINSLAVLAAVSAIGGNVAKAAMTLGGFVVPEGRGRAASVNIAGGAFTVIDESYNASPVSMNAALEVLGRTQPGPGGRRIAVLGDMLELGPMAGRLHEELAAPLQQNGVDLVFTAGANMSRLTDVLPRSMRGGHAADSRALAPIVTAATRPGDVVMVKGSAGSRTGLIVNALRELASGDGERREIHAVNGE
ncbi:MAG: UDP-N-acetylmuramoylalanyl-D-glutamyl-2, 6-diaminopimelate--D-alanyl-D-alanine ligase [Rhodospirillales bacterium RIFCSPLOWO2_12_FULL_58_28]|nr:MAG: UDP-N-acetylmuramoylalanyl-D-glutamyl-2, 6-diaminopimelate--D-alanyl-D-alanine ligase [Rhodospirillales bacterium RIFCSPLOWO2_02_FULL_58_16]OHC79368.1 MAG: UDP-N-acetylmuramoylalanyl-D-glutamyl-2, 6-diaminopimelate--D-alanyl-D-alanine ligase [Rhodospirillales bacterium RIFCSPLOWO2_12_FULL_58_28]